MTTPGLHHVDIIEGIRATNNTFWMQILKIALQHAPEQTRRTLGAIIQRDKEITAEMEKILAAGD